MSGEVLDFSAIIFGHQPTIKFTAEVYSETEANIPGYNNF